LEPTSEGQGRHRWSGIRRLFGEGEDEAPIKYPEPPKDSETGGETRRALDSAGRNLDKLDSLQRAAHPGIMGQGVEIDLRPDGTGEYPGTVRQTPKTARPPPEPKSESFGPASGAVREEQFPGRRPRDPQTMQLAKLLQEGNIGDFNKLRPTGRLNLSGLDLSGLNLSGVDLRDADLTRAILKGADLTGALFQRAVLDRADLTRSKVSGAKFYHASMRYTDLTGVLEARKTEFVEADLHGAELKHGNFQTAVFNEAKLYIANLTGGNFSQGQFLGGLLAGAILTEARFRHTNLQDARLFQANGLDVDFGEANLTNVDATQAYFSSTDERARARQKRAENFSALTFPGLGCRASCTTKDFPGRGLRMRL